MQIFKIFTKTSSKSISVYFIFLDKYDSLPIALKIKEYYIKKVSIGILVTVFLTFGVQYDDAGTGLTDWSISFAPKYLFRDYSGEQLGSGLIAPFTNPTTRISVISYLHAIIGDSAVADALIVAAERYRVDPALVVAVAWQESRFQANAYGINNNKSIDRGLMQLNSSTFKSLGADDFFNPYTNADYGTSYLRKTLDMSGNIVTALAMYNAGPGRVGSLGAPTNTLNYIDKIITYKNNLVRDYYRLNSLGSVLIISDFKPVKNPNYL